MVKPSLPRSVNAGQVTTVLTDSEPEFDTGDEGVGNLARAQRQRTSAMISGAATMNAPRLQDFRIQGDSFFRHINAPGEQLRNCTGYAPM